MSMDLEEDLYIDIASAIRGSHLIQIPTRFTLFNQNLRKRFFK